MTARRSARTRTHRDWVASLAHEAGNLLTGIRLSSHFIVEEEPLAARASLGRRIDRLVTEAGALLSPLGSLRRPAGARASIPVATLLAALQESLADGVDPERLRIAKGRGLPPVRIDMDATHALLVWLACGALGASEPDGRLRVGAARDGRRVRIRLTDDAPALAPAASADAPLRGRELALALGEELLRERKARLAWEPRRGGNHVDLWLPAAASRPRG